MFKEMFKKKSLLWRIKQFFSYIFHHLGLYAEELILLLIIFLNIDDFLELISPEWDYIKKIISWTALGYLLYKASLTHLFFGEKHKRLDLMLVLAYFLMTMKNFINYAHIAQRELTEKAGEVISFAQIELTKGMEFITIKVSNIAHITTGDFTQKTLHDIATSITLTHPDFYLRLTDSSSSKYLVAYVNSFLLPFINTVVEHAYIIEKISFLIGGIILIVLSFYFAYCYQIRNPSLLHVIHEEGDLNASWKYITRPVVIFIVLIAFFIIVFNLMMEWLAVAIDAPLAVIGIFSYLFFIIKHHEKFHVDSFLFKMGNFGEEFYERFIDMFHSRSGIILGISGMLVLHLLTDVGNYLVPYLVHVHDLIYFEHLGPGHEVIFNFKELVTGNYGLFIKDFLSAAFPGNILILVGYMLNIIAMTFILIFPAYIWYAMYKRKCITFSPKITPLIFASITCFLISPIFIMRKIQVNGIVGVDIATQSILTTMTPLYVTLLLAILVFIIVYAINKITWVHDHTIHVLVMVSLVFFMLYIYYYFTSFSSFFIESVISQFQSREYVIGIFFLLFFMISIIFYLLGTMFYLNELRKVYRY